MLYRYLLQEFMSNGFLLPNARRPVITGWHWLQESAKVARKLLCEVNQIVPIVGNGKPGLTLYALALAFIGKR